MRIEAGRRRARACGAGVRSVKEMVKKAGADKGTDVWLVKEMVKMQRD